MFYSVKYGAEKISFLCGDRSLVTICVFMGKGMVVILLRYHIMNAKRNGITKSEMAEIITHAAF